MLGTEAGTQRPCLLVLASTYPRWQGDPEPGFVHELAKRLTGRFRVLALVPHAPGARRRETMDGVEVIRYRYAPSGFETLVNDGGIVTNLRKAKWKFLLVPGFVLSQAWSAWHLLRRERVAVIHAHWLLPQGMIAALLRYLPGSGDVPFLVTSHGADLYALRGRWLQAAKRFVLRRAASVTVVSSAMLDSVSAIGAAPKRIAVEPMGVDLSARFTPVDDESRSPRELLFVGRLVEKKGLRFLLDAFPAVLAHFPEATLSIAGFGPEEATLREQVRALELGANVRFLGGVPQSALPSLYRRAALFVAPFVQAESGDQEGLGLVMVEALGCGCPVIAGDVPAVHEVRQRGGHFTIVDPRDASALVAAIVAALERRQSASDLARSVADFDWSSRADAYGELLLAATARR